LLIRSAVGKQEIVLEFLQSVRAIAEEVSFKNIRIESFEIFSSSIHIRNLMFGGMQTSFAGQTKLVISSDGFNAAVDALASRLRIWGEMRLAEELKVTLCEPPSIKLLASECTSCPGSNAAFSLPVFLNPQQMSTES
jgi:hypothetical protein